MRALCLCLALALLAPATAEAKAPDVAAYDAALAKLPFGQDLNATVGWVRDQIEQEYAPRLHKAFDRAQKDRLRKQLEDEVEEVESTYTRFDGTRTGFEVSILKGEFAVGTKEAVLTWRRGKVTHWFLFVRGKFWKYARAMPPDTTFKERVKTLAAQLGQPSEQGADQAIWKGGAVEVVLVDRRAVYQADLLAIRDAGTQSRIAQLRVGGTHDDKPDVDPDLDGILDSGPSDYD